MEVERSLCSQPLSSEGREWVGTNWMKQNWIPQVLTKTLPGGLALFLHLENVNFEDPLLQQIFELSL